MHHQIVSSTESPNDRCIQRCLISMKSFSLYLFMVLQLTVFSAAGEPTPTPPHDGSHDFDFLIGNWKAHVRRLPDRLVGSNNWIEYDGISNHKKLLDSNANFEEFEVDNPEKRCTSRRRP
jgi:hypothetical protein